MEHMNNSNRIRILIPTAIHYGNMLATLMKAHAEKHGSKTEVPKLAFQLSEDDVKLETQDVPPPTVTLNTATKASTDNGTAGASSKTSTDQPDTSRVTSLFHRLGNINTQPSSTDNNFSPPNNTGSSNNFSRNFDSYNDSSVSKSIPKLDISNMASLED